MKKGLAVLKVKKHRVETKVHMTEPVHAALTNDTILSSTTEVGGPVVESCNYVCCLVIAEHWQDNRISMLCCNQFLRSQVTAAFVRKWEFQRTSRITSSSNNSFKTMITSRNRIWIEPFQKHTPARRYG